MKVRRRDRARLIYYLRVFDAATGQPLGQLIDLNPEGMMLAGEQPIEAGKSFSIRMDLPKNVMQERNIEFTARSKWCRRDPKADSYATGFQILEMPEGAREVVQTLMSQFLRDDAPENPDADMNPPLPS